MQKYFHCSKAKEYIFLGKQLVTQQGAAIRLQIANDRSDWLIAVALTPCP